MEAAINDEQQKKGIFKTMKRFFSFLLFALIIFSVSSCSEAKIKDFKLSDISDELKQKVQLSEMFTISSDDLFQDMGIDAAMYKDSVTLIPTDSLLANRMFFFEAVDADKAVFIETKLKNYLEQQKVASEDYSPTMYAVFNKASVSRSGNFVHLVVVDKIDEAKKIIEKYELK